MYLNINTNYSISDFVFQIRICILNYKYIPSLQTDSSKLNWNIYGIAQTEKSITVL